MHKRMLSWLLTFVVTIGIMIPQVQTYAAEDDNVVDSESSDEFFLDSDNNEYSEEKYDTDSSPKDFSANEEDNYYIQGPPPNDAESNASIFPSDLNDSKDEDSDSQFPDSYEVPIIDNPDIQNSSYAENDISFSLRDIELMYGESGNNDDGHLDRLFSPVFSYNDSFYELKTNDTSDDDLSFTTYYKFITDIADFTPIDIAFSELSIIEKENAFDNLTEIDLSKVNSGENIFVAAMAITSDKKVAYTISPLRIIKRSVMFDFPRSELLSVSKSALPESGYLTIHDNDNLISLISIVPSDEYLICEDENTVTIIGTPSENIYGVPQAKDVLIGDININVSELNLDIQGYQSALTNFECTAEFLANFNPISESVCPILVNAENITEAESCENTEEPYNDPSSVFSESLADALNNQDLLSENDTISQVSDTATLVTNLPPTASPENNDVIEDISSTPLLNGCENFAYGVYYLDGMPLEGLWAFDSTTLKPIASGNSVLKNNGHIVKYYDSVVHTPMSGTITINNKLYYFSDDTTNLCFGASNKDGATYNNYNILVNKMGQLLTGWQKPDGSTQEHYYDPQTGIMVKDAWVPKGKGYTWVNSNGLMMDDSPDSKSLSEDGTHIIGGKNYCFKGGVRQYGLIYFSGDTIVTKAKADHAKYFDPTTGEMYYSDSTDCFFFVSDKKYYADNLGRISLGTILNLDNGKQYYTDKTGYIQTNKLISYNGSTFFADEDGSLIKNCYKLLNGKVYYFDSDGKLFIPTEGQSSDYSYIDESETRQNLYIKFTNTKKPSTGAFFYKDSACKEKLTNSWLYDGSGETYYVNNKGSLVSGVVKIKNDLFYFEPSTYMLKKTEGIVEFKGKYYACTNNGSIITQQGCFLIINHLGSNKYIRVKNSNGNLMTGLQTIDKKKYFFNSSGILEEPGSDHIVESMDANVRYLINPGDSYNQSDPSTWYIYMPGKMIIHTYDNDKYLVNKNGSLVCNGWGAIDGKKYYSMSWKMIDNEAGIVKIKNKYYMFNEDSSLVTGWQIVNSTSIADEGLYSHSTYDDNYLFLFDQNTGAMQTGWKTIKVPEVSSDGEVMLLSNKQPSISSSKKKVYFSTESTSELPIGALAMNRDMDVSGKLYRFSADGSLLSGESKAIVSGESDDNFEYYINKDGSLARGRTLVTTSKGRGYYYFALTTGKKETDVIRKTGKKWYYYDKNGKQSITPSLTEANTSRQVVPIFKADGSISKFVWSGWLISTLKNTAIRSSSGELYFLGNDGLPKTGMISIPGLGITILIESDGKNAGDYTTEGTEYQLYKSGSKYYMLKNGILMNITAADAQNECECIYSNLGFVAVNTDPDDFMDMFSLLSEEDQLEAMKYQEYCNVCYGGVIPPSILLNYDGSIYFGKCNINGIDITTNRLGISKDYAAYFVNDGVWRISGVIRALVGSENSISFQAQCLDSADTSLDDSKIIIKIEWNNNGILLPITDAITGEIINGDYVFSPIQSPIRMKIANGEIVASSADAK